MLGLERFGEIALLLSWESRAGEKREHSMVFLKHVLLPAQVSPARLAARLSARSPARPPQDPLPNDSAKGVSADARHHDHHCCPSPLCLHFLKTERERERGNAAISISKHVNLYVCIYLYLSIYLHIYIYTYMYVYTFVFMQ